MTLKWTTASAVVAAVVTVIIAACSGADSQEDRNFPRNAEEFDALFQEVSNAGRWGPDDERGTANLITPDKVREAAALVQSGITVSLAHNPMPDEAIDNPDAAFNHTMSESLTSDTYEFTYHGYGVSHIDSLCHFAYKDMFYNNVPRSASSAEEGCTKNGISNLQQGIVTRGILLDIPRLKGVPYLEPTTPIYIEDIEAWEEQAGVTVGSGDVIFIRTGRWARRAAEGPLAGLGELRRHSRVGRALDPRAGCRLRRQRCGDRRAAVAGGGCDAAGPHPVDCSVGDGHLRQHGPGGAGGDSGGGESVGVHADRRRSPRPIPVIGGTGSPLNPIAIF